MQQAASKSKAGKFGEKKLAQECADIADFMLRTNVVEVADESSGSGGPVQGKSGDPVQRKKKQDHFLQMKEHLQIFIRFFREVVSFYLSHSIYIYRYI